MCWSVVLGKGCGNGGMGEQQEGHIAFSHFPAFLDDAELWKVLACLVSPHKRQGLGWGQTLRMSQGAAPSFGGSRIKEISVWMLCAHGVSGSDVPE